MTVIIDSNILIAYSFSDEPHHSQAKQILHLWHNTENKLVAPRLFRSEITAIVRKLVYQQRTNHEQGRMILSQLLAYPVQFVEDDDLLKSAFDLAAKFNRPRAYDSQYLALAERLGCEFWTADKVLFNSTYSSRFTHIRWLGDFE